ncbi:MAG: 3-oxoadipate enol-lactonase [Myxococcales bacterium]
MPYATVGPQKLFYLDEGRGFPLVLIHGLAGDHQAWAPQIAAFRDRHRIIALDSRGAGRSTQADEPVSTLDMARDTLGLLEALAIPRAHVVGRSMGGAIAQHLALLAPERVQSLVLCASFARLDPVGVRVLTNMREVLEWRGSWADHARHSVQNFVSAAFFNRERERVANIEQLIGGETRLQACYVRQNHACLAHDTLADLHRIAAPTLVLAGRLDPICSPTATGWLAERIPGAKTVFFEKSSHFFLLEEPEKFQATLGGWLELHTPASPR